MREKDIPYRNSYAYVERVKEGKKIIFKVCRTDGTVLHAFPDKEKALTYAKHLETWKPLWADRINDEI